MTAKLSGTITIGSGANEISFPVTTAIPPAESQKFEFAIVPKSGDLAEKIAVGPFFTWAADQIDAGLNLSSLPESLQTLTVAVKSLSFSNDGKFELEVEIGKMAGGVWDPSWKPINAIPSFKISNVTLEVKRPATPPT
jgi:hypothetical protein